MKKYIFFLFALSGLLFVRCGDDPVSPPDPPAPPTPPVDTTVVVPPNPNEVVYDETGCLYTSYNKLVMAGYQGWFSCQGDPSRMGWVHYPHDGQLKPGSVNIDYWPDMAEYENKYAAPGFQYADGSQAYLFSSSDSSTVDLHFKWMKEYGIDGVFVQRFVSQTTGGLAKERVNTVLRLALKAAKKYGRAIAIMYDGSAGSEQDYQRITSDWNELVELFNLYDNVENPTFLRHNGKPVFSLWGYGFTSRGFDPAIFDKICENIRGSEAKKVSIMLGVPYNWRTLSGDCVDDDRFHESLKKWVDIISPWAVGRYNSSNAISAITTNVTADLKWCADNKKDYSPVVYPGFSWRNMQGGDNQYDATPREKGDFLWKQVVAAKQAKAKMAYVAMFDELDEGTCIFKCETANHLPLNGTGKFIGYENEVGSDHYLWLTGKAADLFHGGGGYGTSQPIRK
ncbi:MAG: hypothetical protein EZS26_000261 [Candidatus Ordinivivax streblomastigis]|uniref:Xylosidase n=1 Tax=Candidatus Ordinivivax streblomastigis TaxID=2540710 RepID=A0A5M8P672_9BACT|nr:MAG: hypothetical protein EZS26_000261 [Candidatus Ordinivivax streblomastigis]